MNRDPGSDLDTSKGGYWALSIIDLDHIIDRIEGRAELFGEAKYPKEAADLREIAKSVRQVRDGLLARNYDAQRARK